MIRLSNPPASGGEKFRYVWNAGGLGQDAGGGQVDIAHNMGKYACNVVARYAYNTTATETNSYSYSPGRGTIIWASAFDGYFWGNVDVNTVRFNSRSPSGGSAPTPVSILIDIFF